MLSTACSYAPMTGSPFGVVPVCLDFPGGPVVKNLPALHEIQKIPGFGRAPGGGNGNPLQYSCLEDPWTQEPSGL